MSGRQAEALRKSRDARAEAQRVRVQTVRVAELVASTQGRVAALLDELAQVRPQDAQRLRALSAQARQRADRQRVRAYNCARDALLRAAAETATTPPRPRPGRRALSPVPGVSLPTSAWPRCGT